MRLAFDAKRAFRNNTGLGQYSRNLLNAFFEHHPQHQYYLMTTGVSSLYVPPISDNIYVAQPRGWYKPFPALWRSKGMLRELRALDVNLYHGLSHEIPIGLSRAGIKSVVTIHDLIFERYPHQYNLLDVIIYRRKFKYACNNADTIIAISHQTKRDIQEFYKIPEHQITVCYQSCNPAFGEQLPKEQLEAARKKYNLPGNFLLSVGSVVERKNLLNVCKALQQLRQREVNIPLVVIGKGGRYMQSVKSYVGKHGLKVYFLSERPGGVAPADMPAIYQCAHTMIYPSVYEGFGIPVLEALWSRLPVITSNLSCLPETGGEAAYYIDPLNIDEMANAIDKVMQDDALRTDMVQKGLEQAQKFTPEKCAASVMDVYKKLL